MYLNRILLLVLVLLYVFAPMMADWIAAGGTKWYRPHLIWLLVIERKLPPPAARSLIIQVDLG